MAAEPDEVRGIDPSLDLCVLGFGDDNLSMRAKPQKCMGKACAGETQKRPPRKSSTLHGGWRSKCLYHWVNSFQFNGYILNCTDKVFDLWKPVERRSIIVALKVSVIGMANVDHLV